MAKKKRVDGKKHKVRGARALPEPGAPRRNWRPLLVVALAVGVLAGLSYGGLWLWRQTPVEKLSRVDALDQVRVEGPFRAVTQRQIEETLLPYLRRGFFTADIRGMRKALLRNPWITDVSINRRWPRGVLVTVREAQPLAVWGKDKLLVASGKLLPRPAQMQVGRLPELAGDEELVERIVAQYQALAGLLTTRDMEVKRLSFDELGGWRLELVSGVVLRLGHDELLERVNRFLKLSHGLLAQHMDQIARIDTRYSNAVAVQWKESKK
ncbi:FtsQ-type POTRA domain-containing protein [Microbulbifer sp. SAOS-129_SWC]|uniref:cell division protein FtsQ/DivIB n=1 Tax=Microbulbifer sp. SAOS-129_SWC TaxID=3145235 RepID=UPI0032178B85